MSESENELPSDEEEDDDYVPSGEEVQEEVSKRVRERMLGFVDQF